MTEKVALKDVLACVDNNYKGLWSEIDDSQRKALKNEFFILNRYISNVKGQSRELQEHFVLTVNEFYNKNWNILQNHPGLLWQLLCMCSHESKKIFFHEWIGFKKKEGNNKVLNFLEGIYPTKKQDEIEMMAEMLTLPEVKELARKYGYDDKQITKMFK